MNNQHSEWLNLVPHSGPFLAEPVLEHAFPQGLDKLDPIKRNILRQAYDEWREALDTGDTELLELHRAWIEIMLRKGLELDDEVLRCGDKLPDALCHDIPEYGMTLRPDCAVVDDQNDESPLLLIQIYEPHIDLEEAIKTDGWATTPAELMVYLCKATKTRLGLLTNGEHWLLVDAPEGGMTSYASWYGRLWGQEPIILQAFIGLLSVSRYFCEPERKLPYLIDESIKHQDEVTESLGEQVSRAVEVLIQALDKADLDRNRELLQDVEPQELYEAALTVMMRLVFLLCAEERDLLLLDDERYQSYYAVSTFRQQLRDDAHRYSEEVLDHRYDAWSRLLSTFRAVYGGIEHDILRLPALGGSLFDPDRFPFLEGRSKGSKWKYDESTPLPIDNRTVLFLLEAIQLYRGRTLSYRALDVEQIGYVYEGLLERTAFRAKEVTLELDASKKSKVPWITLAELESANLESEDALHELLKDRKGSSVGSIRKALNKNINENDIDKLLSVCRGDQALRDRIKPYFHLIRTDSWGYPLVYPKESFMVKIGTGRRETGTHYTPKSLTEAIVKETLEPVVYIGPTENKPREEWQLKTPADLIDLKICDPAMGSGAFLVQVCRYLSERLVEAWAIEEQRGKFIDAIGREHEENKGFELLRPDIEERIITARRLIAEKCLYGVDINPLAVELAKLSIWLVTLAKGRPFGFLDHNLRSGDSLLGITNLKQIMHLHIVPERGELVHHGLFNKYKEIENVLNDALERRRQLREIPILDINDVDRMQQLDYQVHELLKIPELVADVVVGEALAAENEQNLDNRMKLRAMEAAKHIEGDLVAKQVLERESQHCLNIGLPGHITKRHPFHWVLEFPEVFNSARNGFTAIVGNPPWGSTTDPIIRKWMDIQYSSVGDYETAIAFIEQSQRLLNKGSVCGLLLPNTILLNDSANKIRDRLCLSYRIVRIADLTDYQMFKSANVRCCSIIYRNSKQLTGTVKYSRSPEFHLGAPDIIQQESLVARKHWANLDAREINIPPNAIHLEKLFTIKQGYKPYDKHALMRRMSEAEAIEIVREKPWHAEKKLDETYVHELRGRDVLPYNVLWSGLWASYGPWVSNYLDPEWFSNDRVLVREIVGKPPRLIIASKYSNFAVHNPSIICIKPKSDGSHLLIPFLELYLNSILASKFISLISSKASKGMFPKVLVKELKKLPFPPIDNINDEVLKKAAEIRRKIDAGGSLELADAFIEEVFKKI